MIAEVAMLLAVQSRGKIATAPFKRDSGSEQRQTRACTLYAIFLIN